MDEATEAVNRSKEQETGAFTVIELLVVFFILSILAIFFLPVVNPQPQPAYGTHCLNNGKQLALAMHMYADDNRNFFPPSIRDGRPVFEHSSWIGGDDASISPTDLANLLDTNRSRLTPYLAHSPNVWKCSLDKGVVSGTGLRSGKQPRIRSYGVNTAVGTKPGSNEPVDAPGLDYPVTNSADDGPWRTYATTSSIIDPVPAKLWLFAEEAEADYNLVEFLVSMRRQPTVMRSWPGTHHNFAGMLAFADGHSEVHKWHDPRTGKVKLDWNQIASIQGGPDNADIAWLQERTSAPVKRGP